MVVRTWLHHSEQMGTGIAAQRYLLKASRARIIKYAIGLHSTTELTEHVSSVKRL